MAVADNVVDIDLVVKAEKVDFESAKEGLDLGGLMGKAGSFISGLIAKGKGLYNKLKGMVSAFLAGAANVIKGLKNAFENIKNKFLGFASKFSKLGSFGNVLCCSIPTMGNSYLSLQDGLFRNLNLLLNNADMCSNFRNQNLNDSRFMLIDALKNPSAILKPEMADSFRSMLQAQLAGALKAIGLNNNTVLCCVLNKTMGKIYKSSLAAGGSPLALKNKLSELGNLHGCSMAVASGIDNMLFGGLGATFLNTILSSNVGKAAIWIANTLLTDPKTALGSLAQSFATGTDYGKKLDILNSLDIKPENSLDINLDNKVVLDNIGKDKNPNYTIDDVINGLDKLNPGWNTEDASGNKVLGDLANNKLITVHLAELNLTGEYITKVDRTTHIAIMNIR